MDGFLVMSGWLVLVSRGDELAVMCKPGGSMPAGQQMACRNFMLRVAGSARGGATLKAEMPQYIYLTPQGPRAEYRACRITVYLTVNGAVGEHALVNTRAIDCGLTGGSTELACMGTSVSGVGVNMRGCTNDCTWWRSLDSI